jgi:hypothetical protein
MGVAAEYGVTRRRRYRRIAFLLIAMPEVSTRGEEGPRSKAPQQLVDTSAEQDHAAKNTHRFGHE